MRSSCSVTLSAKPSPVFAGAAAARLNVPAEIFTFSDDELIAKVYAFYQTDQLTKFSHLQCAQRAQGNYLRFVEVIEAFEKTNNKPLLWAIGKGFTVYNKTGECFLCDRRGELIEKAKLVQKE